jgi:hypothetical protein
MRRSPILFILLGLAVAPLAAQGRRDSQGIPPGQLPPSGLCRVWYEGRPPGQQPRATNCRDAERVAARDSRARVIYGSGSVYDRNDRAIPRPVPRYPGTDRRDVYTTVGFDTGYKDGYDKGRSDGRDNDRYDPNRQSRYRSADHGYKSQYGSKAAYQRVYRDGFRSGYDAGYRDYARGSANGRAPGIPRPWPF